MKITEQLLQERGWVKRDGYMYLPGNPRMGWWPDGRLVVGWWDYPEKITEMGHLEAVIKESLITENMEEYINKEVSMTKKIVGQIRTRVPKGERYWYIGADKCIPVLSYDMRTLFDDDRYRSGNYYTDDSEAEAMAEKIRKVLKGADVIEMPSEEELDGETALSYPMYMGNYKAYKEGWKRSIEWLKSKIVK